MRSVAVAVALGLAFAGAAALGCGGANVSWQLRYEKKNEISLRLSEIREWRREAGMSLDPPPHEIHQWFNVSIQKAKAVCPASPTVSEACSDVCTLAEHICDNAEQICILADELGKDDHWAQEKCASAKASCREAKRRCCTKCSEAKVSW